VDRAGTALIGECARVLFRVAGCGCFALNPLSPYRWRWRAVACRASEPMPGVGGLREAGLDPEPISQGVGPRWRHRTSRLQHGPGLRAAYLLRAEKRGMPLTPLRQRRRCASARCPAA
jgi:hypothetical protein